MIFWIVMHINELMFSPIEPSTRSFLQFTSYIELFFEVLMLFIFIAVFGWSYFEGKKK